MANLLQKVNYALQTVGIRSTPAQKIDKWLGLLDRHQELIRKDLRRATHAIRCLRGDMTRTAARGDATTLRMQAQELIVTQREHQQLNQGLNYMNELSSHLRQQRMSMHLGQVMQQSASVMRTVNKMQTVPQIHQVAARLMSEMNMAEMHRDAMQDLDLATGLSGTDQNDEQVEDLVAQMMNDALPVVPATRPSSLMNPDLTAASMATVASRSSELVTNETCQSHASSLPSGLLGGTGGAPFSIAASELARQRAEDKLRAAGLL